MRGLRLDRLTNRPYLLHALFRASRGDKIRTCGLSVPNAALYQTEPRLELFPQCFDSILDSRKLVNKNLKRKEISRARLQDQVGQSEIGHGEPLTIIRLYFLCKLLVVSQNMC